MASPANKLKAVVINGMLAAMALFGPSSSDAAGGESGDPAIATRAVNQLGLDLLEKGTDAGANALLSPYSVQSALAMTYAGAAGETRTEMAKVLHYPKGQDDADLHGSFAALRTRLDAMAKASEARAKRASDRGETVEPVRLTIANRLFGQDGYDFRPSFLELTKNNYGAPFQLMNFKSNFGAARAEINSWVEERTSERIRDLIPAGVLNKDTRLVLVNAVYLKAPWAEAFQEQATKPEPFHVKGGNVEAVPTMIRKARFGYQREAGFTVVAIPYTGGDLQFLVLLPDAVDGLPTLEKNLTADTLATFTSKGSQEVILHLPKFKLEPPVMGLGETLQSLGMRTAFDQPRGSANFDRMAQRKPDDYLYLSDVFHKTFLEVDEKGTEAAAATAAVMMRATSVQLNPPKPVEVKVDHPFLFAIQQRSTGTCLFLGRMVDPR